MARIDLIGVCKTLDDGERRGATFRIEDLSLTVPDGRTQPATREHHRVAVELIFKEHASLGERPCAQIAPADLEDVEADVDRRRAQDPGVVVVTEQMEPAHQLLVEDRDLAVEHEDFGAKLRDRGGELAEARGVIDAVAGDEADARPVLVGEHAPAVDLLLVDPAVTMEGRADERRGHGDQRALDSKHRRQLSILVNGL